MKSSFTIESPGKIECTLKATMTLDEWTALRDQLKTDRPSSKLAQAINVLLADATKVFSTPSAP